MQLQRDLISVVIPAYNQPQYLRSALQSIVDQDYRPIEVIVSDDCSPTVLQPVTDEFSQHQSDLFTVRYFRAAANRGVIDNFRFAVEQARGTYLVPMAHDNRFVDRRFFTEAVRIMGGRADCHLCYGNAFYENSDRKALNIPVNISLDDGWAMLEGKDFIRLYRRGGMDWSQAIVLDNGMAHSLGAYDVPYVVNGAIARRFGISQDDMFSYVFLLSAMGSVGLCEKPVCEIGTPPESYSRSAAWKGTKAKVKFFIFYNIWRGDIRGKYAPDVRQMARKQALQYADRILDPRMGSYYRWAPHFLLMMGLGVLNGAWSEIRYAFKRGVNIIRPNTFKKTGK
jgi:glycosyltransferase involved in cell wall biosynthesis